VSAALRFRKNKPGDVDWAAHGVEIVLECSGKFRTPAELAVYFERGVKVIVAAPVKGDALNIVMGVNDGFYEPAKHHLLTNASCTTNCLAPVVKVMHEGIGIEHGAHHDAARRDEHPDARRRAAQRSAARAGGGDVAHPDDDRERERLSV